MAKISNFLIVLSLIAIVISPSIGQSYILPSVQIIEIMTNKFATIRTLHIIQLTKLKGLSQETEKIFGESIYLMSPDLYRSEIAGEPGKRLMVHNGSKTLRIINGGIAYDRESQDFLYRFLLLAQNPKRLLEILKDLGINLEKVSLTRFNGRIAYLIGEREEGSPSFLVDKDLFLPLLLKYDDFIFHFSDYKEILEETWYPYQIVFSSKGTITEEYMIKDITVNPPIEASLFNISPIRAQFSKGESKENALY